jgi:Protein of unknown function (DUF3667)
MSQVSAGGCVSCGAPQAERFCSKCGEKRISAHDYSILHFGESLLETFTHFDFRVFRAVKVIFVEPGEPTRAYLEGRRKAFVGPIQLFVIVNVVFALIGGNVFKTPLRTQERDWPFRGIKRAMTAAAIEHSGLTRESFEKDFDRNAATQSKTWIFAMIPALALCLAVLYGFRRYYFEHLVFATHFYAFMMLFILAASVVLGVGFAIVRFKPDGHDIALSLFALGCLIVYSYFALRRTYDDGRVGAAFRAVALGAAVYPVLVFYRFLLFFVTLKTMH